MSCASSRGAVPVPGCWPASACSSWPRRWCSARRSDCSGAWFLVRAVGPSPLIASSAVVSAAELVLVALVAALVFVAAVVLAGARRVGVEDTPGREGRGLAWELVVLALAGAAYYELASRGCLGHRRRQRPHPHRQPGAALPRAVAGRWGGGALGSGAQQPGAAPGRERMAGSAVAGRPPSRLWSSPGGDRDHRRVDLDGHRRVRGRARRLAAGDPRRQGDARTGERAGVHLELARVAAGGLSAARPLDDGHPHERADGREQRPRAGGRHRRRPLDVRPRCVLGFELRRQVARLAAAPRLRTGPGRRPPGHRRG